MDARVSARVGDSVKMAAEICGIHDGVLISHMDGTGDVPPEFQQSVLTLPSAVVVAALISLFWCGGTVSSDDDGRFAGGLFVTGLSERYDCIFVVDGIEVEAP